MEFDGLDLESLAKFGDIGGFPDLSGLDVALDDGFSFDIGNIASELENLGGLDYSQFNLDSDLFGTGFEDDISSALQFSGDTGSDLSAYLASSPGGDYFGQEDLAEADLMRKLQEYQQLPGGGVQDLGAQGTLTDEGLLKIGGYDRPGGFTSQWQTTPSGERVFLYDESGYYEGKPVGQTGIGVRVGEDGRLGDTRSLTTSQIQDMIKKGELNTFKSGYFGATGGTKIAPGGGITTTTKDGKEVVLKPDGKVYDTNTGKVVTNTNTIREVINQIKTTGGTQPGQQQNMLSSLLPLLMMMLAMNRGGGSSGQGSSAVIPALTATQKQTPYTQIQQAPGYRPGQGGITYFNPTQYAPRMAGGGIIDLARALAAKRREQRQGLLKGRGDGVSDSIPAMIGRDQPARLARGEYVVDARTVAELGNGSTDAGAERLDEMRKRVHAKRKKAKVGEDSKARKALPV